MKLSIGKSKPTLMSKEARTALETAGLTRRGFLEGAGALIVSFCAAGAATEANAQTAAAANIPVDQVDSWVAITRTDDVLVFAGRAEFGQGMRTVQYQLVAEELEVAIERVKLTLCDTGLAPDQGVSSGSQAHPVQFGPSALRQALATAREALKEMAARELNIPVSQLFVNRGVIYDRSNMTRWRSYGQLIGTKKFNLAINPRVSVKSPWDYSVLGTSVPRYDLPEKALGIYEYVQNVRVPGMLHGKVVRPPAIGAKVVSVDRSSVASLPGNVKVVVKGDFVGVVADREYQAMRAAETLKVTWTDPPALPAFNGFYDWLRTQPSRDAYVVRTPDVDTVMGQAARTVTATYRHPYQMHGSIASSCAVADIQGGSGANAKGTIWSATQGVYPQRDSVARVLDIPQQNLRVIFVEGSGCYGINGADTVSYDAALLSQGVGKPVRVQYTRADEMIAAENYGPAFVIDFKVGLDSEGTITAWDQEAWTLAKGGRPNATTPGNIITGALVGFATPPIVPAAGANPTTFNNGNNAASSYSAGIINGNANYLGKIRTERVLAHTVQSPFFTGPLRSPNRLQYTFAHESFIDEVAAALRQDPVAYRLRHLQDHRIIDVLNAAAQKAGWDTRPSPKPGNARTGVVTGRGIACVLYEGDNGYCGLMVEVEVDQATGIVTVTRMVASQDSGPVSNPNGMMNQMEGGAMQGMSRALREEVRWDDHSVTSQDWRSYPVFQFGMRIPQFENAIINRPDEEHMGAGECTITVAAAAIGNAIFDATGARIREVPFTPARVLAALRARP